MNPSTRRRFSPGIALSFALGLTAFPTFAATYSAPAPAVNVRNMASVKGAFRALTATGNVAPAWTGNVSSGNAGTVSEAYKKAALRSVNIFRALAGVPPVVFDSTLDAKCAQAALMMSANRTLSHAPPASFTFFTADGAEAAANANLFLGFAATFAIPGYIEDSGDGNTAVGHRRWILWSQSSVMGTGDVLGDGNFPAANALWVLPTGVSPAPTTRNGFVAWPYAGTIPNRLVFKRWSFSHPSADLTQAKVKVRLRGRALPVRIVDRDVTVGVGDRTIVFEPKGKYTAPNFQGTLYYQSHLAPSRRPVTYTVTVSNVNVAGVKRSFTYRVKVFRM